MASRTRRPTSLPPFAEWHSAMRTPAASSALRASSKRSRVDRECRFPISTISRGFLCFAVAQRCQFLEELELFIGQILRYRADQTHVLVTASAAFWMWHPFPG